MSGLADHRCIVCGEFGPISLGIRARFSNTNAVWAPNLDAYLCDAHAKAGCRISIHLHPSDDGRVRTVTNGPKYEVETALRIGTGVKEQPGQESLL